MNMYSVLIYKSNLRNLREYTYLLTYYIVLLKFLGKEATAKAQKDFEGHQWIKAEISFVYNPKTMECMCILLFYVLLFKGHRIMLLALDIGNDF